MQKWNRTVQCLKGKFRLQHNKIILSLQYCKLHRRENESMQEWMGKLCINTAECNYKEHDKWLKEQFINSTEDEEIMQEITKELIASKHVRNIQKMGTAMGQKSRGREGTEKGGRLNEKHKRLFPCTNV